jgi:hypothetical protein
MFEGFFTSTGAGAGGATAGAGGDTTVTSSSSDCSPIAGSSSSASGSVEVKPGEVAGAFAIAPGPVFVFGKLIIGRFAKIELLGFDGNGFFTSTARFTATSAGFDSTTFFAAAGAASFSASLKKSSSSNTSPPRGDLGDVGPSPLDLNASTSFAICFAYNIAARDVYFCPMRPRSAALHPCFEKNALALSFPFVTLNTSSSFALHRSMFALFTMLTCTPSDRWTPEQSRQTKTPKFFDVHFGHGDPQSKHARLPPLRRSAPNSASRAASSIAFAFAASARSGGAMFASSRAARRDRIDDP